MGDFIRFDFTEQDTLDSFDYFMENCYHKKTQYYLDEIIDEFLQYIEQDIVSAYGKENLFKCRKFLKNRLTDNKEYLYKKYGKDTTKERG